MSLIDTRFLSHLKLHWLVAVLGSMREVSDSVLRIARHNSASQLL